MSYMSQEGYDNLIAELHRLEAIERPKASAAIAEAREKGDLSENSEYDAAKEAQAHLEDKINKLKTTISEAKQLIDNYYKSQTGRKETEDERTEEADKVSERIAELLSQKTFTFSPSQLVAIHRHLFQGIYKFAGKIRDYNITKKEWVLDGDTVSYGHALDLREMLEYDFLQERNFRYNGLSMTEV